MGFLDNSGDVILDVVLTDTGRKRLARGDGSFKISKFAVCDTEIDYTLYDPTHPSGSAYYDLEILQLPVFEAFTNNTSGANSNLISIPRNNLLYLPVARLNTVFDGSTEIHSLKTFIVCVDEDTEREFAVVGGTRISGILQGENIDAGGMIRVDQGLDTTEVTPSFSLDSELIETQYIVKIDNRFGSIVDVNTGNLANVSYVDDDNIASYFLTLGTDPNYVKINNVKTDSSSQIIEGPRGTYLQFKIKSSIDLNSGTYLFTTLGTASHTGAPPDIQGNTAPGADYYYIDTVVRVTGGTTGYTLDIPVRFVKFA